MHGETLPIGRNIMAPLTTIRVLIADDKELDREGVKALLHNQPDIEIVGTADSTTSVAPLVRQHQPDVILLDLHWHGNRRAGEQIIHEVRAVSSDVRIIAHSQYPELVEAADAAGADVAVTKTYDRGQLVSLIRGAVGQAPQLPPTAVDEDHALSERELQVLGCIAEGDTDRAIATKLNIATNTVKRHVANIFRKLDVQSRAEAVNRAHNWGLL
jgi:DNA-binding NarL/FixJ family response regulator